MKRKMLAVFSVVVSVSVWMFAGSIAHAQSDVIHACVNRTNGQVRIVGATAACRVHETPVTWNATGPAGAPGPAGPAGPPGPPGPAGLTGPMFLDRNFQNVALAPFPGVTTAALSLPAGTYMMFVKFRYRGNSAPGSPAQTASCVFQGVGIGGLDASQNNVPPGGELSGQVDAFMMDVVRKNPGDDPDVHVQCFGPSSVSIINTQFLAVTGTVTVQP